MKHTVHAINPTYTLNPISAHKYRPRLIRVTNTNDEQGDMLTVMEIIAQAPSAQSFSEALTTLSKWAEHGPFGTMTCARSFDPKRDELVSEQEWDETSYEVHMCPVGPNADDPAWDIRAVLCALDMGH